MAPPGSVAEAPPPWALPALAVLALLAPFHIEPISGDHRLLVVLRPLLILQLIIGIGVIAITVRHRPPGARLVPRGLMLAGSVLVVMVWLSAALSNDPVTGAGGAAGALAFVTTTMATALTVRTAEDARRLVLWLVVGATIGSIIGLCVLINDGEFWFTESFVGNITRIGLTPRLTRPWSHANVAAMALGPAVSMVAIAVMAGRTLWQWTWRVFGLPMPVVTMFVLAVLALLTTSLVLTYSRGGLAGAVLATALCIVFLLVRFDLEPIPVAAVAAVVGGLIVATMVAAPAWGARLRTEPSRDDFLATVVPPADLELGSTGQTAELLVINRSGRVWPAAGPSRVQLSARVLAADSDQIVDEQRWPLPAEVAPGAELTVTVLLTQQVPDGRYEVLWDLLIDREAYFLQFSDRSASSTITVVNSPVAEGETTALVTPRANLSRPELWRLAVTAFSERPLLGVGPSQLAAYVEPDLADDQRFPGNHAHNLALEALATWGLFGAIPLFVILLGGAQRAWRSAWRGDSIGLVVLAGLIASGVHATVEWQINEVSAALPMAILLGIGWSTVQGRDKRAA